MRNIYSIIHFLIEKEYVNWIIMLNIYCKWSALKVLQCIKKISGEMNLLNELVEISPKAFNP